MKQGSADNGPRRSRAWLFGAAALVVSTLGAAAYYSSVVRKPSELNSKALEPVRLAVVAYIGSCPIMLAQANGYFASEGVDAVIKFEANGKAALAEALQGRADLATTADIPIMYAAINRQPVSVVAIMTTMEDHAIVGRRDRDIVSPASLKGKRIGVSIGTTTQFFLDAYLNRQKLSPADVTVIDLAPVDLANALEQGNIDAGVLYQPFLNISVTALGSAAAVFSGQAVCDVLWALAGSSDYVATHRQTLEKVLRATIRGAQFCKESPGEARAALAKSLKWDAFTLEKIWASYQFDVVLRQGLLLTLEDEARWAIRNKLTAETKVPNYLNYLDADPYAR